MASELARRNAELSRELEQLRASRSWRMTAPLRQFLALLHRWTRPQKEWVPTPLPPADPGEGPVHGSARWLVDVTDLAINNFRAGVQRVSLRIFGEWLISPPEGIEIVPVRLTPDGGYCHAHRFLMAFTGGALGGREDKRVVLRPGDLFVGLELTRDYPEPYGRALKEFKAAGVNVAVVLHDVLPLSNPEWFPPHAVRAFEAWFDLVSRSADALLCISNETREQASRRFASSLPQRPELLVFPLGCDVWGPALVHDVQRTSGSGRFRVLTVGTLEPRKGYEDVLAAMDGLWSAGVDMDWHIVGRMGWGVDTLVAAIRAHPEAGKRLFWTEWADDAALFDEYSRASVLVCASRGEGFGLPVVEGGSLGVPLMLRDIPVFREVGNTGAMYFSSVEGLMDGLRTARSGQSNIGKSRGEWPLWEDSAKVLADILSTRTGKD